LRISSKGRYGLAAMIVLGADYPGSECVTVLSVAEKLGISKIYLEQVFTLLKRAELVNSVKGSQGGYRLTRPPELISAYDILRAAELSLFESTQSSVEHRANAIELAMDELVWQAADRALESALADITLAQLCMRAAANADTHMFYI